MKKHFDYPLAVYVATFANGETARLSVGARKGKVDFDRARNMVAHMWRNWHNPTGGLIDYNSYFTMPPRTDMVAGHVEHEGDIVADPFFAPALDNVITLPKRRRSVSKISDPIDAVLSALGELSLSDLESVEQLIAEMINEKLAA